MFVISAFLFSAIYEFNYYGQYSVNYDEFWDLFRMNCGLDKLAAFGGVVFYAFGFLVPYSKINMVLRNPSIKRLGEVSTSSLVINFFLNSGVALVVALAYGNRLTGKSTALLRVHKRGTIDTIGIVMIAEFLFEFIGKIYILFPIIDILKHKYDKRNSLTFKVVSCVSVMLLLQSIGFFFPKLIEFSNSFAPLCYFLTDFLLPSLCFVKLQGLGLEKWKKIVIGVWLLCYFGISCFFLIGGITHKY